MNPYAGPLGDRDPRAVIAASPDSLRALMQKLGARADTPRAPGKWSPRQIACHLADCEVTWAYRLRQVLAEHHHVIQPFDQERWAEGYSAYDAASALAVFTALRAWNLALIAKLTPGDLDKQAWHPERGVTTVGELIATMAGHDLNHLGQLEQLAAVPG